MIIEGIETFDPIKYRAKTSLTWREKDSWYYDFMTATKGRWFKIEDLVTKRKIGNSHPIKYFRRVAVQHGHAVELSKDNTMMRFVKRIRLEKEKMKQ